MFFLGNGVVRDVSVRPLRGVPLGVRDAFACARRRSKGNEEGRTSCTKKRLKLHLFDPRSSLCVEEFELIYGEECAGGLPGGDACKDEKRE